MSWHTELWNVLTYRIYQSDLCPQPPDRGVGRSRLAGRCTKYRYTIFRVPSHVTVCQIKRAAAIETDLAVLSSTGRKKNYVREAWAWQLRTNISSKQVVTIFMGFFVCLSQAAWRGTTAALEAYFCGLSIHWTDACFLVTIITDHDKNSLKKLI